MQLLTNNTPVGHTVALTIVCSPCACRKVECKQEYLYLSEN